jgi:uncharacterized Fe-S cluster-containing radical SAM superfamily protein
MRNKDILFNLKIIRKQIVKILLQLKAQFTKKRFYCNALTGNSGYNISINSDMSVSCNCQDYDCSACIGDLSSQSLIEIFNGPQAKHFRQELAKGKLPILSCTSCEELRWIDKDKSHYFENNYHVPKKGILLENTVSCNLNCKACPRDIVKKREKKNLNSEDIKKVSLLISKHHIEELFFFKFGEPFISYRINDELKIIRNNNPDLKIILSTNGILLDSEEKREASLMVDLIYFSIDGNCDETVKKYQRGGSFEKAYNNMIELVKLRNLKKLDKPIIEWKYVLFNWNDKRKMIFQAIKLAEQAGVDIISFWPARKPVYGISWRYYLYPYFKTIGHKSWKGREITFKTVHLTDAKI